MEATANNESATAQQSTEPVVEKVVSEEKPNSKQLLDFARKESEWAKKEVARKEEIAKLQEQLKTYESEREYFSKAKDTYRDNPEELLGKLGITYDQLTDAVIDYYDKKEKGATEKAPDPESIRKEIEAQFRKAEEERRAAATNEAVEGFVKEITSFVEGNSEKFPHLTQLARPLGEAESPTELLFGVVESYYNETGELLPLETAAATAEEYLREEWAKLNGVVSKTAVPAKTEKIVEAAPEAKDMPSEGAKEVVNATKFKRNDYVSPTISNTLSRRQPQVPHHNREAERRNVIERAVKAMEDAARK